MARRDLGPSLTGGDDNSGAGMSATGGGGGSPKGGNPPAPPGTDVKSATYAEQARPVPILYGTAKMQAYLIEKSNVVGTTPPAWAYSTAYEVGALVYNFTRYNWNDSSTSTNHDDNVANGPRVYRCKQRGTSVPNPAGSPYRAHGTTSDANNINNGGSYGPVGTAAHIEDSTTYPDTTHLVWEYVQELPMEVYEQHFICAICEGESQGATGLMWWDKETVGNPTATLLGRGMTAKLGVDAANQVLPTFDSSGYQHTAVIYPSGEPTSGIPTGASLDLPAIALEWQGVMFGLAGPDVNPSDILADLITHARRGAGLSSSRIDTSVTGTGAASMRTYCDAIGFRVSMLIDAQRSALSLIADIMRATNCEAIWSGGKLKVIPLGDQSITSPVFGATNYVPSATSQYTLTADDFLDAQQPVKVERTPPDDTFNSVPVEYTDRGSSFYARTTVESASATDVQKRGLLRAGTVALPVIYPDGKAPTTLSKIVRKRNMLVRRTYTFRLSWRYVGLEPTDLVELSLPELGAAAIPVRIVRTQRAADRTITVTAEDYPAHVSHAAQHTPQAGDGYLANDVKTVAQLPMGVDGVRAGVTAKAVPNLGLSYGNFSNLWPNPGSENAPPSGIVVNNDGSQPEWDYRKDISATFTSGGTLSGTPQTLNTTSTAGLPSTGTLTLIGVTAGTISTITYTGKTSTTLTGCTGSAVVTIGDVVTDAYAGRVVRELVGAAKLYIELACVPGEGHVVSVQARRPAGSGTVAAYIEYYDTMGVLMSTTTGTTVTSATAWASCIVRVASAPANTGKVRIGLLVGASTTGQFDAINVIRFTDPSEVKPSATNGQILATLAGVTAWAPNTAAIYHVTTAMNLANAAWTVINYNASDVDTDSAVATGAAWAFTVPAGAGGRYLVSASVDVNPAAAGGLMAIEIGDGSGGQRRLGNVVNLFNSTAFGGLTALVSSELILAAGDKIQIRAWQNSGGALAVVTGAGTAYVSIQRVAGS